VSAAGPQVAQGEGARALGHPPPVAVADQIVVVPARYRQAQERLEEAVDVGGVEQILAAGDERHPLGRVVDHDREVIARRHVLAGEHHVAEGSGVGLDPAGAHVVPGERPGALERPGDVQPPGIGLAPSDPPGPLGRVEVAAGAGIEPLTRGPVGGGGGGGDFLAHLLARAEAGIEHTRRAQPVERLAVERHALGLADDGPVEAQAEPAQILEDRGGEFRPAALRVEVLEAEQEAPAREPRRVVGEAGGIGMPQMQIARGARGETGDVGGTVEDGNEIRTPQGDGPRLARRHAWFPRLPGGMAR
jgi:hypothetical protein